MLNVVREAEQKIANDLSLDKEYLPIGGDQEFVKLAQGLILGESCAALREDRVSLMHCPFVIIYVCMCVCVRVCVLDIIVGR